MADVNLETIFDRLRASAPDELLETLFELRRVVAELSAGQRSEAASAVASLFYLDVNDRPEMASVVEQAIRLVHDLGPDLIPQHLQEMRGSDFKALFCFAKVLARFGGAAVAPVLEACRDSDDSHLLVGAIYSLTKIRDPAVLDAFDLVASHATSADSEVRDTAVRALGKLIENRDAGRFDQQRRKRSFEILLRATHDPVPGVRAKAVRGIGKLAAKKMLGSQQLAAARDRLEEILGRHEEFPWDPAFIVRREGAEAMETLS